MINKYLIFTLLLIILPFHCRANNLKSDEKITVTTTITPISSLVAMIAGDKAKILTVASTNGCPHHYFLKPSDLEKMESTDLFIYIDTRFDVFAEPLLEKFSKPSIKISSLPGIRIINDNLHLWLLPDNAIAILKSITQALAKIKPEYQGYFQKNLDLHIKKMKALDDRRMSLDGKNIVLLSDSAEYIFSNMKNVIIEDQSEYSSIKSIRRLKTLSSEDRYFVINTDQDIEKYKKLLGDKIFTISTENWEAEGDLSLLYYSKYEDILNKIINSCNH